MPVKGMGHARVTTVARTLAARQHVVCSPLAMEVEATRSVVPRDPGVP